jgi:hypothetical protein
MEGSASNREKQLHYQNKSIYFLIPVFKQGNTIEFETESREVGENRVRVSDGRNSIELRTRSAGKEEDEVCKADQGISPVPASK